jgi:hypothetical protein
VRRDATGLGGTGNCCPNVAQSCPPHSRQPFGWRRAPIRAYVINSVRSRNGAL